MRWHIIRIVRISSWVPHDLTMVNLIYFKEREMVDDERRLKMKWWDGWYRWDEKINLKYFISTISSHQPSQTFLSLWVDQIMKFQQSHSFQPKSMFFERKRERWDGRLVDEMVNLNCEKERIWKKIYHHIISLISYFSIHLIAHMTSPWQTAINFLSLLKIWWKWEREMIDEMVDDMMIWYWFL